MVRPGCGDQFARDAGRHDCQRLVRRARTGLWHNGGSHQPAGNFNQRRARGDNRFRPELAAETARPAGRPDFTERAANYRALSAGPPETLVGIRAGPGDARAGKSGSYYRRQRRHARRNYFCRTENRPPAGEARGGIVVLCVRGRSNAGGGRIARFETRRH